jgi:hypothetical protein
VHILGHASGVVSSWHSVWLDALRRVGLGRSRQPDQRIVCGKLLSLLTQNVRARDLEKLVAIDTKLYVYQTFLSIIDS